MSETKNPKGWLKKQVENAVLKDNVPMEELFGIVIIVFVFLVAIAFFAIHQTRPTGFFTSKFGTAQAVLLYLVIAYGLVPQTVRIVTRSRNQARIFDIMGSVLLMAASLYFLATFPFDFSHFKDPLPRVLEPLLAWVSDDIAKVLMVIGVVGSAVSIPYQYMLYRMIGARMRGLAAPSVATENPPPS